MRAGVCTSEKVLGLCAGCVVRAGVLDWAATEEEDLQSILDEEDNVKTRIIFAREELKVGWSFVRFSICSLVSVMESNWPSAFLFTVVFCA